ncbi:lipid II:glycine glycyltransferase FemX [Actinomycetospora sp. C-140]
MNRHVAVEAPTAPTAEVRAAWDALVVATPGSDVNQLGAWARVRATLGYRSRLLLARQDGRIVGGAQVLLRPVGPAALAYVPSGPVVARDAPDRVATVTALAAALDRFAGPLRPLFVQPPDDGEETSRALLGRGFRPSDAGISPAGTLRLDLAADEETLRAGLGRRLRYWTNKWPERGVTVRRGDAADVPLLAALMARTAEHQGYDPLPTAYVEAFHRELAPDHAVLFVGEVDGRPVAADLLTGCGGVIKGRLGGFDRSGEAGKLSVPGAMRWAEIRWAREQGYRWFDFGGIDTGMLDDLLAGRTDDPERWPGGDRAKLSFGGVPYAYPPAVERIVPAPVRLAYDTVRRHPRGRAAVRALAERLRGARPRRTVPGPHDAAAQQK